MKNARPTVVETSAVDSAIITDFPNAGKSLHAEVLLMSSREIAELTGKLHSHVLRDIREMLTALGQAESNFGSSYRDATGRTLPMFLLPKDLSITLVAGYDVVMRHRIVNRWQQLESSVQVRAVPRSLPEALRLAAELAEAHAEATAALAIASPKAAALDRIATAEGSTCVTNAAKNLQIQPKKLFAWMQANKWIYRRPGGKGWVAYQDRIRSGHLEHKVAVVDRQDGTEKAVEQVLVTPKGLVTLATSMTCSVEA